MSKNWEGIKLFESLKVEMHPAPFLGLFQSTCNLGFQLSLVLPSTCAHTVVCTCLGFHVSLHAFNKT